MSSQLELVLDAKATLAEGPTWDEETQKLYWLDIEKKQLNKFDPVSKQNVVTQFDQYVSAVALKKSGGLVLAMQHGFYFMDLDKDKPTPIIDPEAHLPNNRFNDGKCDPLGQFWAGTMSMNNESEAGALYCLNKHREVSSKISGVSVSNGLAWSPDGRTMYYIDSPTKQVVAYDFDAIGNISNRRVVVNIPEGEGVPDGMTIDEEGHIWVAQWGGYKVSRWNVNDGTRLAEVSVPAAHVTSCTFGGDKLDELYITTARSGLTDRMLAEQPLAGGIFKMKTGVKGLPAMKYDG